MAGRNLEVLLDRVEVNETGDKNGSGRHMLLSSLIWPRPRIAERTTARTLEFEKKVADLKGASWADRIVWKEVVDGPFALEFAVTERVTDSQLATFLRALGSSILKLAGDEAEDMIAGSLAGGVMKTPFQFLSRMIADSGKHGPKVIATGSLDLHSEATWAKRETNPSSPEDSGVTRQFKMPLTATETIYRVTRTRKEGTPRTRRRKLLDAGAENGVVVFTGRVS